jgi:hypothetical protein
MEKRHQTSFKAKRQRREFRSRREEGRGKGVKNLKGSDGISESLCWKT